jgi:hypothetical protein
MSTWISIIYVRVNTVQVVIITFRKVITLWMITSLCLDKTEINYNSGFHHKTVENNTQYGGTTKLMCIVLLNMCIVLLNIVVLQIKTIVICIRMWVFNLTLKSHGPHKTLWTSRI